MAQSHVTTRPLSQSFLHPRRRPPPDSTASPSRLHFTPTTSTIKQQCKYNLSRREFTISSNSCLLLLIGSQVLLPSSLYKARAEENLTDTTENDNKQEDTSSIDSCIEGKVSQQAFLDVSIDGAPVGRIVIGLTGDQTPAGVDRFTKLVSGAAGVSYRRKEFVRIMPNYVQHGGVRSYGVDAELARNTGSELASDALIREWEQRKEKCPGTKNVAGSIGIIVRDPSKPPPKMKLVARQGKLEIDEEETGSDPNGTEFVITTKDSPELDSSALVIGRVIGGMDVVERINQVKTVKDNTGSPYFRVAKLVGDKRAVVAERGFNRPYSKVIVTNCGLLK